MNEPATSPGIHRQRLPPGDQRVTLAIPEAIETGQPLPLVMVLHYGGTVTPYYGESILTGLAEPALRDLGAVLAAPDCTAGHWANEESEAQVMGLLDTLMGLYPIDPGRTLLTGYSLGGVGTWYLAARYQDRFAAALPMAAQPLADSAEVEWRIPLYVLNSRQDEIFDLEPTEAAVTQLRAKGVAVQLVVLDGITHFQTARYFEPLRAAVPWIRRAWST